MSNQQLHQSIDILPPQLQKEVAEYVAYLYFKYTKSLSTIDSNSKALPLKFGSGKHLVSYISDDFDAPLDDFKEYMP